MEDSDFLFENQQFPPEAIFDGTHSRTPEEFLQAAAGKPVNQEVLADKTQNSGQKIRCISYIK